MTDVWDKIENLSDQFLTAFEKTGVIYSKDDNNGWKNFLFSSDSYRRAHVEIVDFRSSYKIYILHCTVFPHVDDASPIWGFDAVCGSQKITGAFHDFSVTGDCNHPLINWFSSQVQCYEWNKPRALPEWAQQIFSPHMIAVGNIRPGQELDDLCNLAVQGLDHYLMNVGLDRNHQNNYRDQQNRYCYYQKQNPKVVDSMVAMGIPRDQIVEFVEQVLFPEI